WGAHNPPPNIHIGMEDHYRASWVEAYRDDSEFKNIWADPKGLWTPGQRFFPSDGGLLFFRDADYQPRLCVPKSKRKEIKTEAHEAPLESAH
ncbi:hypothetical protein K438DRAFT_1489263, partial [Mycena galopus ATCC 62051]